MLSAFSMIGMLALSGVAINDAVLLVESAQRTFIDGVSLSDAFRKAARIRFRPILLTSLTTFFGLLPLLFEPSPQAAWLKPMGITLAVGIVFTTPITLLLLPAAFAAVGDMAVRRGGPASEGVAPTEAECGLRERP